MEQKKLPDREQYNLKIPTKLKEKLENEAYSKGYSLNAYILMKLKD